MTTVERANPMSLTNSLSVMDQLLALETSTILPSKASEFTPKKQTLIKIHFCLNLATPHRVLLYELSEERKGAV
jgi:hypothetical protein